MEKQKFKLNLPHLFGKGSKEASSDSGAWSGMALVKKILLAVASLLLAMTLWGYVLMAQNPDRTKTYGGISVKLESGSEADLLTRNLMVYGDVTELLSEVSVTVSAPLTDITKITAKDITATVSYNDIHDTGISRLEVRAVCGNNGTVVDIDPSYIEVDVDRITTRTIPVDQTFSGELPEGYWHGAVSVSPKTVTVKGARRDIENISSAVCTVDLSQLTDSVNRSFNLLLTEEDGSEFDQSLLLESIPSVNVQMQVLPYKQVDITYEIGDSLPEGLSVAEQSLNIGSLTIAADERTLAGLDSVTADTVFLSGIDSPGVYDFTLTLNNIPDDAVVIDHPSIRTVRLTVVVEDTVTEMTFEGIAITVSGIDPQCRYTYYLYDENGELGNALVRLAVDVAVKGAAGAVEALSARDLVLSIDVTGFTSGEHDVPIRLAWNEALGALDSIDYNGFVHVVVERAEQP